MNVKRVMIFFSILVLFLNIILVVNLVNSNNVTTRAVSQQGYIGITIEQKCGDGICLSEESCSNCPADCLVCPTPTPSTPSSGGGGGRTISQKEIIDFDAEPDIIKNSAKIGESAFTTFEIVSKSTKEIIVNIKANDKNVFVNPNIITLGQNQRKTISTEIKTDQNTAPGLYAYEINLESNNIIKIVTALLQVKTRKVYFDATLSITEGSKNVRKGGNITINPTIFNLGDIAEGNVTVDYFIKDLKLNTLYEDSEDLRVGKQASLVKTIELPEGIEPGRYVVGMFVRYKDSLGMASDVFEVNKEQIQETKKIQMVMVVELALIIVIIIVTGALYYQHKKLVDIEKLSMRKIGHLNMMYKDKNNHRKIKKKIDEHIELLNASYKHGYVNKKTYEKFLKDLKEIELKLK